MKTASSNRLNTGLFVVALALLQIGVPVTVKAGPNDDGSRPSCSIEGRRLTADLPHRSVQQAVYSVIFAVSDQRGGLLFKEIIPIAGGDSVLRISTLPLDIEGLESRAAKVTCHIVPALGDVIGPPGACAYTGHVDLGIEIRINMVELIGSKVFIDLTASRASNGILQLEPFTGEPLFFRSAGKAGILARTALYGPSPTSLILGADSSAVSQVYELGAGFGDETATVATCL